MSTIRVISAAKLDDAEKKKIESAFSKKHKEKVDFCYELDAAVLGGVLVIDGELYYDATVKGQLSAIRERQNQSNAEIINKPSFEVVAAGIVKFSGDGVIIVEGLKDAKYGELLIIEGKTQAIVLSLEENEVGAIVLDQEDKVSANMIVHSTGYIVEVPVGEELLGRVVNPLGIPIDGLGDILAKNKRPIETPAAKIMDRDKVREPMQTGILAIDSMIPIGKGQRELIIGDRQTGKTTIAIDTIINQKGKDVYCIYVAIGQKASTVRGILNTLIEYNAMEYTTIVCSTAKDSSPMQYIAPYAGCAMAEEFMYKGKDVLIIYDDLSKHAVAYRAMSLLLKRPPGREAYPGDVFYLHSRLLERAAKLKEALGGGSMTALPIVETQAGDISSYIPTNVISITDGQIYLESDLFNAGVRPAVNVGLSVSRVGSGAQIKAMRKISGKLRLDLSQYRDLAIFAQFGSELDAATSSMLIQGERTTEALKQEINSPLSIESQVIILYITMKEILKKVPVKNVRDFTKGFLRFLEDNSPHIIENLKRTHDLSMEDGLDIEDAIKQYSEYYFKTT